MGQCLIVKNLGCDILIGEPAKEKNNISTHPPSKTLATTDNMCNKVVLSYASELESRPVKMNNGCTVYSNDFMNIDLPRELSGCAEIVLEPDSGRSYPLPGVYAVKNGQVRLPNPSDYSVTVNKDDIVHCTPLLGIASTTRKIYDLSKQSMQQFELPYQQCVRNDDVAGQFIVDPDNKLSPEWKQVFNGILSSFTDIFSDVPGRYNGSFGQVNCSVTFTDVPPPSIKPRLPNYPDEKLKIMAAIMDDMEKWGVLAKPESLGIIPTHVHPCILVPKSNDKFRLVTDFRSIQSHIKQLPTIMPTVSDAMTALSSADYHIELDFSNYYWQNGIPVEDSQYLAICHPYGGLRVYTVLPQGLRNSAEWGSEILARIYGDMVKNKQCTRIADQIYVLGNSPQELASNFTLVLNRARQANLTFKPSKISICPSDTVILGWRKSGNFWQPTQHILSPLSLAEPPSTVKKLRGWLGAYRQIAKTIPNHAVVLQHFEKLVGGKNSKDRISWTPELLEQFDTAKASIATSSPITIPKPSDKLKIFPDWSQDADAVGGRMIIERSINGTTVNLHGGEFSCRLKGAQSRWTPCEKECLAIKLLVQHFQPYIRESSNITTIYTDNIVAVHAWEAIKLGKISTSSRVASFISTMCENKLDIVHFPGELTKVADYNSRHPVHCSVEKCQTCQFVMSEIKLQDNYVRSSVSLESPAPLAERPTWLKLQKQDPTHSQLYNLIQQGQQPEKKSRNKNLKLLHNMYRRGTLFIAPDGLIQVKQADVVHSVEYKAISIPDVYFPGLVQSLHLKLNHPSPYQLMKVMSRQFFCIGMAKIINNISASCDVCCRLKILPKEAQQGSTQQNTTFGKNFSADVLVEKGQHILLLREKLSQFTCTKILLDETSESIAEALIVMLVDIIPESGAKVQVDPGPSLVYLSNPPGNKLLANFNIVLDIGRIHNKQKNPIAENAIKEFRKEWLRLKPEGSPLTEIDRATITSIMNKRVRLNGLAPKEVLLKRDLFNHDPITVDDQQEGDNQYQRRTNQNNRQYIRDSIIKVSPQLSKIRIGDRVYIKSDLSKSKAREEHIVTKVFLRDNEPWVVTRKTQKGLRNKEYLLKLSEVFPAPFSTHSYVTEHFEDEDDFTGFQENITLSKRDKLQKIIKAMEQSIPTKHLRGRPRAPVYPDYLSKLPEDVQVNEEDELCVGFSEGDLTETNSKLSKLHEIINRLQETEEHEEDETLFYGFEDYQVQETREDQDRLRKVIQDLSDETVNIRFNQQKLISTQGNSKYPWDYQQWLQILEEDMFEEYHSIKKHQPTYAEVLSQDDIVSDADSIVVDSPSFDDTEFTFYSPTPVENVIISELHNLDSPLFQTAPHGNPEQRMSTPVRSFLKSETDPLCIDRIPVLSSSESSIEFNFDEIPSTIQETQQQPKEHVQLVLELDRVVNVQTMLDTVHRASPALQPIQPGRVYNLEPILADVQTQQEAEARPLRTRRKHDYKRLNSDGFYPNK